MCGTATWTASADLDHANDLLAPRSLSVLSVVRLDRRPHTTLVAGSPLELDLHHHHDLLPHHRLHIGPHFLSGRMRAGSSPSNPQTERFVPALCAQRCTFC